MAINERYRKIRAAVRELGCCDSLYVVWAYSQYLQVDGHRLPDDIQVHRQLLDAELPQAIIAEFTLEQVAREVIRHADIVPRRGRTLRQWDTLAGIVNDLRALEEEIYSDFKVGDLIQLELMRIAHRQFAWQQHKLHWKPVIRYYKLFNTPEISAKIKQATGLTLNDIYIIGMCYLGIFYESPRATRVLDVQIRGFTQEHIDRFLAFTSLSRNALANRLRVEHALDEGFGYRYSSLREFPLVRISHQGREEVACPIPTLLFWRITTGLYYTLKDVRGFLTEFGSSFQRYVGEVLQQRITSPDRAVIEEQEYHVGRDRKDTVDWIINQGNKAALFIECKTKRLTWASKSALVDLTSLQADINKLASAVVQVYKTVSDYRTGHYPQLAFIEQRQIFPIIVTLEDWHLFGREMPGLLHESIRSKMAEVGLPEVWLEEMPYSILSLHELEQITRFINEIDISTLILNRIHDPGYSQWSFSAYCSDRYGENRPALPPLFQDEYNALFADLAQQLGHSG